MVEKVNNGRGIRRTDHISSLKAAGCSFTSLWGQVRRIFGPKRAENGEWRRLHNEELHSLFRSLNIKSRRLRWSGHVARMEEGRSAFKLLAGKPTNKRPLGGPRVRTILEWTLKKYVSIRGTGYIRLRIGIIREPLWMLHWTSGFFKPVS